MFGAYLSDGFGSTVIWKPISAVSSENFETAFEPNFFLHLNRKISKEMTLGVYGLWKNLVLSSWCGDYSDWPVILALTASGQWCFFQLKMQNLTLWTSPKKPNFFEREVHEMKKIFLKSDWKLDHYLWSYNTCIVTYKNDKLFVNSSKRLPIFSWEMETYKLWIHVKIWDKVIFLIFQSISNPTLPYFFH